MAAHDGSKAREDKLQVLIPRHWIELAYEEDVLWWSDVGKREVTDHFEGQG